MVDVSPIKSDTPSAPHNIKVSPGKSAWLCGARQNEVLADLPHEELSALASHLDLVELSVGADLFTMGQKLAYVYFPTTAIVSLQYVSADGASTEIAVISREGVVGMSLFIGELATSNAVVQNMGYAFRVRTEVLREAFGQGGALPQVFMRYANSLFTQLAQNAVSSQHGTIEQKVCRWLLDRLDRSGSNELKVTQGLISLMLGVRRESITAAAHKLQAAGLIQYRRGTILIVDRAGLEDQAGECYAVAKTVAIERHP